MILIIEENKSCARAWAEMFNFMGIPSCGADTADALSEIGSSYSAAITVFPEQISDLVDYVPKLRRYGGDVPIFALTDRTHASSELFAEVWGTGTMASELLDAMNAYCKENALREVGHYRLAGLDASIDVGRVVYRGEEIMLTKTEKLILRYLIRTYPTPQPPTRILKHAFRESRSPLVGSVRTHIHQINKKLGDVVGAPKIESVGIDGYTIGAVSLAELV